MSIKRISIAGAVLAGLLTIAASGAIVMASGSADGDGSAAGNTQFVGRVVESLGLEREAVRETMDRAKRDLDGGAAGSGSFAALVAGNLAMETRGVEAALERARRDVLRERLEGRLASATENGRPDRGEREVLEGRLRGRLAPALEEGAIRQP